jgi:hypothetical protein
MTHILKSEQVKLEGQLQLNTTQIEPNLSKNINNNPEAQQVRIVESNPEAAIIEITCRCGIKTYLRFQYNNAESPAEDLKSSASK